MTFEQFNKFINQIKEYNNLIDKFNEIFRASIWESPFVEIPFTWVNTIIESNFSEEGIDLLNWWLFEKDFGNNAYLETYDEKGNIIPSETIEDIWEIIKPYSI